MSDNSTQEHPIDARPAKKVAGVKEIDAAKTSRIPIKIVPQPMLRKP
ncbi:MAG TPA: lipoyl synthase, partial [Methylophilus sp.]|nr:lipoyl synthase [Methylophilus sp.]